MSVSAVAGWNFLFVEVKIIYLAFDFCFFFSFFPYIILTVMEIVFETLRLEYLTFTIQLLFKQQSTLLKWVAVVFVHLRYLKFIKFYKNYIYTVLHTFLSLTIWLT